MAGEIRVHVLKYQGRANWVARYLCPLTGKQIARSTGETKKREALKFAAKWEAALQEGRYQKQGRMTWVDFRRHYEDHAQADQRARTVEAYSATLNAFERHCRPQRVADLTTARVTAFASALRKAGLAEASVAKHLRHLKAVARWGAKQKLLAAAPEFDMPKRGLSAKMKGRPITGEEFDRMLAAVPSVVGEQAADSWRHLLTGLWWSGLRLGEALALRWDHKPDGVSVRLAGRQSVLMFDADSQKSGRAELVPLAPEAVELLEPLLRDRGFVFAPLRADGGGAMARDVQQASKIISRIGAAAGVITNTATSKTASAHDLRRSFGFRWSRRVMPAVLKQLMRHATVDTTLTYYVGSDATDAAAVLWQSLGNVSGNTAPAGSMAGADAASESPANQGG